MSPEKRQCRIIERVNFPNPELDLLQSLALYHLKLITDLSNIGIPENECEILVPQSDKSFNNYLAALVKNYIG